MTLRFRVTRLVLRPVTEVSRLVTCLWLHLKRTHVAQNTNRDRARSHCTRCGVALSCARFSSRTCRLRARHRPPEMAIPRTPPNPTKPPASATLAPATPRSKSSGDADAVAAPPAIISTAPTPKRTEEPTRPFLARWTRSCISSSVNPSPVRGGLGSTSTPAVYCSSFSARLVSSFACALAPWGKAATITHNTLPRRHTTTSRYGSALVWRVDATGVPGGQLGISQ